MKRIVVFASGSGTNLQYIIDAVSKGILQVDITAVIVNKRNILSIDRAESNNIRCIQLIRSSKSRKEYDQSIVNILKNELKPNLIVLAGWMHIFSKVYTDVYGHITINLHPALPGQFPGAHGIKDAWTAYKNGEINHTGIMVHYVVEEIDAGEVIKQTRVPIHSDDTFDSLQERIRFHEKPLLLSAIQECLVKLLTPISTKIYKGKVRNMHDIGQELVIAEHTDRLSSFDRHICNIPCKGKVLTLTSAWWFEQTRHIIPNHLLHYQDNLMIVQRCEVIPIEMVVRGYITGTTKTSLWNHYSAGERIYCGIEFPNGLVKNQKLEVPVVTPTTKGISDVPISGKEIVEQGIVSQKEWEYLHSKAIELYKYGSEVAAKKGLILVDTKYEFGKDKDGNIILIDEIHTCDSSRYWKKDSYNERFINGKEPERFDKDVIRYWIKDQCNPYKDPLPEIPSSLIQRVSNVYQEFYEILTGSSVPYPNAPNVSLDFFVNSLMSK